MWAVSLLNFLGLQGYRVSKKKAQVMQGKVNYLGYEISAGQRPLGQACKEAICQTGRPQTVEELWTFLGMTGWCRLWIYNYGLLVKPLYALTATKQKHLEWNTETERAFELPKKALMSALALGLPDATSFLSRNTGEPVHRDRLETIEATYASCPDVKDGPMENGETRFTDGSSYVLNSNRHAGYAVTASQEKCQYLRGEFQGPACGRDGPYTPDVFFWCCILFFATFALSSFLKKFKTSRYFPTRVRSTVSNFAVFLTIVIMVLLDFVVGIPLPKLQVPHAFKPTRDDRGWFINPIGPNPWWTVLAALVPALLCTILIFMDQQISAVIVNRKEHKLKKGCGYHLDLFVVAVMLGVCSVMGLPWFVAATVLSITHVNSLKVESDCSAPGEQPKLLGIREQRVTGLLIFVLMGCSVFFTSVLKFIPMPVLYGVFLYMGVSSLRRIQFFDRLKLFWMPAKHQPDFIYLRHVPLRKVHFFTAIQLTCLVLLWTIKVSRAAIIFPMMVLALVFVRKAMDFCFSKRELSFLDDLMPERKKKLDDARNEAGEEEEESRRAMEAAAAASSVQLNVGKTSDVDIPKQSSDGTDPSEIVILDEMSQTTIWKALTLKTETL
ncbi:electroneutral sodium bicarbonate exchanger 1-like isoform X1 [Accipiter gentilis]|uniref:electroneutral sodium bicarbonate exchanger 1-like isoform X1 n=3 Tax=Astur gentilis TaxID=8957 RepID=UPI00210F5FF5|nr:electroneutral sodium bicarbonate exchanger 1-like isoform X1 [Accipiter gentilis]